MTPNERPLIKAGQTRISYLLSTILRARIVFMSMGEKTITRVEKAKKCITDRMGCSVGVGAYTLVHTALPEKIDHFAPSLSLFQPLLEDILAPTKVNNNNVCKVSQHLMSFFFLQNHTSGSHCVHKKDIFV